MDIVTARARIHAMVSTPDESAEQELDRRIDDLIAAATQTPDGRVVEQKTEFVIHANGYLSPMPIPHNSLDEARGVVSRWQAVRPGEPYRIVRRDENTTVVASSELPDAID